MCISKEDCKFYAVTSDNMYQCADSCKTMGKQLFTGNLCITKCEDSQFLETNGTCVAYCKSYSYVVVEDNN